jgi:hypothetical protein
MKRILLSLSVLLLACIIMIPMVMLSVGDWSFKAIQNCLGGDWDFFVSFLVIIGVTSYFTCPKSLYEKENHV